jgi:hypothetical protein
MLNLLDTMFIKRFCLPVNSNIDLYETGKNNISSCVCGHYNHIACILQGTDLSIKKLKILSFGVNQMGDEEGKNPGIHAEKDALNKLNNVKHKKNLTSINLLVIRVSKKNILQSSKPCNNCIETMKIFPNKKGYKIQYIYYSDGLGNIIKTNIATLENEEKHYSKFYRRK